MVFEFFIRFEVLIQPFYFIKITSLVYKIIWLIRQLLLKGFNFAFDAVGSLGKSGKQ